MRTPHWERRVLEDLMRRKEEALEPALLAISGFAPGEGADDLRRRIDGIFRGFQENCRFLRRPWPVRPPGYLHGDIARDLFEHLWTIKPRRFGEPFLLAEVVDAHLDPDPNRPVGNCVGLTSLFSVLALRAGLRPSLLASPAHLLNRLRLGDAAIDLDHTDPGGYACRTAGGFREFPLWMLVANVLNCRGLAHERGGDLHAARSSYDWAIRINPSYANAWNNRGNMRVALGDTCGAVGDYTEAIRMRPDFIEAYCNRGMARQRLGCLEAAREDYQMALDLRPDYRDALTCLQGLEGGRPQTQLGKRSQDTFPP